MSKALQRSLESKLASLDGPEWESSGDEEEEVKAAKTTEKKNKKANKNNKKSTASAKKNKDDTDASEVIYLGHIPTAFEEQELLKFFSQFGKVVNINLCRSKRTGNSKGYAFIQFADQEVASITAEAMSGYFMMGEKRLVCHVVPKEKIHENLFSGAKDRMVKSIKGKNLSKGNQWQNQQRKQVNSSKSAERMKKITQRLLKREQEKREKLQRLGIEYDFPGYSAGIEKATQTKEVVEDKTPEKKRKASVGDESDISTSENAPKSKKKARKTPKKKRSDSDASAEASTKKSRRKNSETSMESVDSKTKTKASAKKSERKNSEASMESIDEEKPTKEKTPRKREKSVGSSERSPSTEKEVVTPEKKKAVKKAVTEKKKSKKGKKSKSRRKSL